MVDFNLMRDFGWLTISLALALTGAVGWIIILLRRDESDPDHPKPTSNGNGTRRRCVYCACDVQHGRNRCPECGKVQPIRCLHCGQIIMNGLADHGPHCPMVVGAVELEDAVEQA